ncbi:MAG: amidase family protein, partial [Candidatus Dormibacteraceae bacterium]
CNGVLGLRPTPFGIPVEVPDGTRLGVRGPLARSVEDLRLGFGLMRNADPPPRRSGPWRIGIVERSQLPVDPACGAAVGRAATALGGAGCAVEEALAWDAEAVARAYQVVRPVTMALVPGEPDAYGAMVREDIARGREESAARFLLALQEGIAATLPVRLALDRFDALLTPTLGRAPMAIAEVPPFLGEAWLQYTQFVLPVSFAGLAAISVPAGQAGGIPVGVQVIAVDEATALDVAQALEERPGFGFERPPGFD